VDVPLPRRRQPIPTSSSVIRNIIVAGCCVFCQDSFCYLKMGSGPQRKTCDRCKTGTAGVRRWRAKDPERHRLEKMQTAARRRGAPGAATAAQISARIAMWGGKCWICGKKADSIDHVIPVSRGGTNWPANLRPACMGCNRKKSNRSHRELIAA
jgi:5-methylcytosine-specific restriction endonuclease McrA